MIKTVIKFNYTILTILYYTIPYLLYNNNLKTKGFLKNNRVVLVSLKIFIFLHSFEGSQLELWASFSARNCLLFSHNSFIPWVFRKRSTSFIGSFRRMKSFGFVVLSLRVISAQIKP